MDQTNISFFKENGYCIVKQAVSNELRDFVTQYALFDEMQDFSPDQQQVVGAHAKYADPAMETMLLSLLPLMESNTGLDLFPTYSFYRVYRPGDELVKHKDRPSCEISCTMCFNYDYQDKNYQWPIYMNNKEVKLSPGDLVIYRGCDLFHWREKFIGADSDWHVQGFFHYVDKNGPNSAWAYDRRHSVGAITKPSTTTKILSKKNYITFTD